MEHLKKNNVSQQKDVHMLLKTFQQIEKKNVNIVFPAGRNTSVVHKCNEYAQMSRFPPTDVPTFRIDAVK